MSGAKKFVDPEWDLMMEQRGLGKKPSRRKVGIGLFFGLHHTDSEEERSKSSAATPASVGPAAEAEGQSSAVLVKLSPGEELQITRLPKAEADLDLEHGQRPRSSTFTSGTWSRVLKLPGNLHGKVESSPNHKSSAGSSPTSPKRNIGVASLLRNSFRREPHGQAHDIGVHSWFSDKSPVLGSAAAAALLPGGKVKSSSVSTGEGCESQRPGLARDVQNRRPHSGSGGYAVSHAWQAAVKLLFAGDIPRPAPAPGARKRSSSVHIMNSPDTSARNTPTRMSPATTPPPEESYMAPHPSWQEFDQPSSSAGTGSLPSEQPGSLPSELLGQQPGSLPSGLPADQPGGLPGEPRQRLSPAAAHRQRPSVDSCGSGGPSQSCFRLRQDLADIRQADYIILSMLTRIRAEVRELRVQGLPFDNDTCCMHSASTLTISPDASHAHSALESTAAGVIGGGELQPGEVSLSDVVAGGDVATSALDGPGKGVRRPLPSASSATSLRSSLIGRQRRVRSASSQRGDSSHSINSYDSSGGGSAAAAATVLPPPPPHLQDFLDNPERYPCAVIPGGLVALLPRTGSRSSRSSLRASTTSYAFSSCSSNSGSDSDSDDDSIFQPNVGDDIDGGDVPNPLVVTAASSGALLPRHLSMRSDSEATLVNEVGVVIAGDDDDDGDVTVDEDGLHVSPRQSHVVRLLGSSIPSIEALLEESESSPEPDSSGSLLHRAATSCPQPGGGLSSVLAVGMGAVLIAGGGRATTSSLSSSSAQSSSCLSAPSSSSTATWHEAGGCADRFFPMSAAPLPAHKSFSAYVDICKDGGLTPRGDTRRDLQRSYTTGSPGCLVRSASGECSDDELGKELTRDRAKTIARRRAQQVRGQSQTETDITAEVTGLLDQGLDSGSSGSDKENAGGGGSSTGGGGGSGKSGIGDMLQKLSRRGSSMRPLGTTTGDLLKRGGSTRNAGTVFGGGESSQRKRGSSSATTSAAAAAHNAGVDDRSSTFSYSLREKPSRLRRNRAESGDTELYRPREKRMSEPRVSAFEGNRMVAAATTAIATAAESGGASLKVQAELPIIRNYGSFRNKLKSKKHQPAT